MSVTIREQSGIAIAAVSGSVDGQTAPEVQAELLPVAMEHGKMILDMGGVEYLSSAGLRMLLLLYRQVQPKKGRIALVGVADEILEVMEHTGFLHFFVVSETLEEGLRSLEEP